MIDRLLDLVKNDRIRFVGTKYLTYLVYFIISIIIANKLGLFYFGIYGFLKLLMQYFAYTNLGVNYSGIVIMSEQTKLDDKKNLLILNSSLCISVFCFAACISLFVLGYKTIFPEINDKYLVDSYIYYICVIVVFKQINQIFINLNRIYNRLKVINWAYLIPCIAEFVVLAFGSEEVLLRNIMWAMMISNGLVTLLFYLRNPFEINWCIDRFISSIIITRGLKLLFYNISFYFIILIAKSFMSSHYPVEEFAQYSFSYNISEAVMLLNNSISFLIYPTLLNKFHTVGDVGEKLKIMKQTQDTYMAVANMIIVIVFMFVPFLSYIVPEYSESRHILLVLLLGQLLIANTFTICTNMVQNKKETSLMAIGGISCMLLYGICNLVYWFNPDIVFVSYGLPITLVVYNIAVSLLNIFIMKLPLRFLLSFTNPQFFIPLIAALLCIHFTDYIFSFIIYIVLCVIFLHSVYKQIFINYAKVGK
ncbi:lipopolysaccharide biosynthesis protein [Bacteroides pyogenes]|uniref:lipopolysaccharide biosynthesis protein n=1 Tax=Bacteroides pyogenes TaxID=310300 RepID=UPI003B43524C